MIVNEYSVTIILITTYYNDNYFWSWKERAFLILLLFEKGAIRYYALDSKWPKIDRSYSTPYDRPATE